MYQDYAELIQINDWIMFQNDRNKLIVYDVLKKEFKYFKIKTEVYKHLSHSSVRNILHYREQGKVNQDIESLFTFHYCCSERCHSD